MNKGMKYFLIFFVLGLLSFPVVGINTSQDASSRPSPSSYTSEQSASWLQETQWSSTRRSSDSP